MKDKNILTSVAIFIVGSTLCWYTATHLKLRIQHQFDVLTSLAVSHVAEAVAREGQTFVGALERLKRRYHVDKAVDQRVWQIDADAYFGDFPWLISLVDVGADGSFKIASKTDGLQDKVIHLLSHDKGSIMSLPFLNENYVNCDRITKESSCQMLILRAGNNGANDRALIAFVDLKNFLKIVTTHKFVFLEMMVVDRSSGDVVLFSRGNKAGRPLNDSDGKEVPNAESQNVEVFGRELRFALLDMNHSSPLSDTHLIDLISFMMLLFVLCTSLLYYYWGKAKEDKLKLVAVNNEVLVKEKEINEHLNSKTLMNRQLSAAYTVLENNIKQLNEVNSELEDFSYIASHDLKEPLRGIGLYSHLLLEDKENVLSPSSLQRLQKLPRLTEQMEELLDALLEYSRIKRIDYEPEFVDLNAAFDNAKKMLCERLKDEKTVVTSQHLPTVQGEAKYLQQLFTNLISNGIKYNNSEYKQIEVGVIEQGGAGLTLYVKDNGIGVPKNKQELIFKLFNRLHGKNKFGGGVGAGLTIAKKIVDRYNGKLWIESEENSGSTFFIEFPSAMLVGDDEVA